MDSELRTEANVNAECEKFIRICKLDDEDAEVKEFIALASERRPADDPLKVRNDVRKAFNLPPLRRLNMKPWLEECATNLVVLLKSYHFIDPPLPNGANVQMLTEEGRIFANCNQISLKRDGDVTMYQKNLARLQLATAYGPIGVLHGVFSPDSDLAPHRDPNAPTAIECTIDIDRRSKYASV